jgi:hypothetical protein
MGSQRECIRRKGTRNAAAERDMGSDRREEDLRKMDVKSKAVDPRADQHRHTV